MGQTMSVAFFSRRLWRHAMTSRTNLMERGTLKVYEVTCN